MLLYIYIIVAFKVSCWVPEEDPPEALPWRGRWLRPQRAGGEGTLRDSCTQYHTLKLVGKDELGQHLLHLSQLSYVLVHNRRNGHFHRFEP